MSEWYETIGTQDLKPGKIDTESSKYYVYERRNIIKVEEDPDRPEMVPYWKYEERKIKREDWIVQTTADNKAKTDAMLSGMTDLYELLLESVSS